MQSSFCTHHCPCCPLNTLLFANVLLKVWCPTLHQLLWLVTLRLQWVLSTMPPFDRSLRFSRRRDEDEYIQWQMRGTLIDGCIDGKQWDPKGATVSSAHLRWEWEGLLGYSFSAFSVHLTSTLCACLFSFYAHFLKYIQCVFCLLPWYQW